MLRRIMAHTGGWWSDVHGQREASDPATNDGRGNDAQPKS